MRNLQFWYNNRMANSYLDRLRSYVEKLIDIRNDLAHAIEEAEFLSIDPPISGVEDAHIREASQAVVLLGSQIQSLESYIQQIQDIDHDEGHYNTNPYYTNPSDEDKALKKIDKIFVKIKIYLFVSSRF